MLNESLVIKLHFYKSLKLMKVQPTGGQVLKQKVANLFSHFLHAKTHRVKASFVYNDVFNV